MIVKQPKGMLSTSPGTGGALMGMISGRTRLVHEDASSSSNVKQLEARMKGATKMIAAAEDVGRRAISVAHLGDQRAFAAMRLVFVSESTSSSLLSATQMEGIEEEVDGAVTDDDRSTEIMTSIRRRRSSSATDKSMADAKAVEDADEMPFALQSESPPVFSAGFPSRESLPAMNKDKGTTITGSKHSVKPTPAVIRAHFSEALSCYLKALRMLKGAIAAAQGVLNELDTLVALGLSSEQLDHSKRMKKRCESTAAWLSGQFKCVLERGDATNVEISKVAIAAASQHLPAEQQQPRSEVGPLVSVEELIYNHAMGYGREGAVKQLLGQFEHARSCYRTAGLLAETLLMESGMGNDDRKVLEEYVDGFAARITELDEVMLQQSRSLVGPGVGSSVATASMGGSSRQQQRSGGPSVVGLVGHPLAPPSLASLNPFGR